MQPNGSLPRGSAELQAGPRHWEASQLRMHTLLQGAWMSKVWVADDLVTGAEVIVKLASSERSARNELAAFQLLAARGAAGGAHPHVVRLLGHFWSPAESPLGRLFLVFERVPGFSAGDFAVAGRHSPQERLRWMVHAASALDHLHVSGLAHQDIKPDNLVVEHLPQHPHQHRNQQQPPPDQSADAVGDGAVVDDDADGEVDVGDDKEAEDAMVTSTEEACKRAVLIDLGLAASTACPARGSALYMAPELLKAASEGRRWSPQWSSDVYSWAISAWEVVSLQEAFQDADSQHALLRMLAAGERPSLADPFWVDEGPSLVAKLLQDCWQPTPHLRPHASVIVSRLQAALDLFHG